MEFGLFVQAHVPRHEVEADPGGAEHARLLREVELAEASDRHGFKYVWSVEHHFLEEVVLDRPDVLEAVAVRGLGQLDLTEEARVLGAAGVGLDLVARDVRLDEEAELHPAAPSRARARLSNRGARCYGVIGDGMELREIA